MLTNHPFEARQPLTPGVHGLSNGPFEGSWPKTRQLNVGLADWLGGPAEDFAPLLTALRAETPHPADAPDDAPPGSQPEARYAPVFIRDSLYGTRCSTVVAVDRAGGGTILERRYAPDGKATGETFNMAGKTDILLREGDRNVFIAECKFWKGPKHYAETIDQLLGYSSWRDAKKTAILVFNRGTATSTVLDGVKERTETHPNWKRTVDWKHESGFRYVFHHPGDRNRELTVTVLVFDVPSPS